VSPKRSESERVSCKVAIICGVLEQSAYSSGGKDGIIGRDAHVFAVCSVSYYSSAHVISEQKVDHGKILDNGYIASFPCLFKQVRGDLLTRFILVKQYSRL